MHVNDLLSAGPAQLVAPDMSEVLPKLQGITAANPDLAYSRLLCPRRLADSSAYHALVIPTFETGRLAGLGLDPAGASHATFSAWAPYQGKPEPTHVPVYYRWFFRTGTAGDFEYLVDLLKPQPADPRVGIKPIDVTVPGSGLPGITTPGLNGTLRLGGALQVPDADLNPAQLAEQQAFENWDQPYPDTFQQDLAKFVNLPDDYAAKGLGADPDPLITAPLYGRWSSLTQRLLTNRDGTPTPDDTNWVHRLNLDPRFRVPAAYGAQVVETNAEEYMNDAWQQIGDVLAANAQIRRLHLATGVSARWYDTQLKPLIAAIPERAFAVMAPVSSRVMYRRKTLFSYRSGSLIQPALTSAAMRRVVRPGGRLCQRPWRAARDPHRRPGLRRASHHRVLPGRLARREPALPVPAARPAHQGGPGLDRDGRPGRARTRVMQSCQRTRWTDGQVYTWLRVTRQTGRGEGSSGLAFDQALPIPPPA